MFALLYERILDLLGAEGINTLFGVPDPGFIHTAKTETHWGDWVRLEKIAEGSGTNGQYVEREQDIGPAVEHALASGQPTVIHVRLDPVANAMGAPHYGDFKSWYTDFKGAHAWRS